MPKQKKTLTPNDLEWREKNDTIKRALLEDIVRSKDPSQNRVYFTIIKQLTTEELKDAIRRTCEFSEVDQGQAEVINLEYGIGYNAPRPPSEIARMRDATIFYVCRRDRRAYETMREKGQDFLRELLDNRK